MSCNDPIIPSPLLPSTGCNADHKVKVTRIPTLLITTHKQLGWYAALHLSKPWKL